jgi:hypothetical protein
MKALLNRVDSPRAALIFLQRMPSIPVGKSGVAVDVEREPSNMAVFT